IRIRPTGGGGAAAPADPVVRWTPTGDGAYETEVAHAARLPLLHRLTAAAAGIEALSLIEPTLDDLYAHFLNSQEAAS
ncbi:ABC transporter ATP-binding protein, partial [Agrobacterium genomosp. 3 str. RTP8]|nr:ABC transporter ATP-binding protein [Agrobacterium tomkonis RTP8]